MLQTSEQAANEAPKGSLYCSVYLITERLKGRVVMLQYNN